MGSTPEWTVIGPRIHRFRPPDSSVIGPRIPPEQSIGLDVALEALRKAWQAKRVTMDDLWHFAGICRMTNVMRPYLESLT